MLLTLYVIIVFQKYCCLYASVACTPKMKSQLLLVRECCLYAVVACKVYDDSLILSTQLLHELYSGSLVSFGVISLICSSI